ncbi:MAG: squalene synthase [Chloroflexota bacterium]
MVPVAWLHSTACGDDLVSTCDPGATVPAQISSCLATRARTFALASRFLPARYRRAVVVLYAFCRVVDDLVDETPAGLSREELRVTLHVWRRWLRQEDCANVVPQPHELAVELEEVVRCFSLPRAYLLALLDGVETDLVPVIMNSFNELYTYCMRVAGTVGLVICHLLGARHTSAYRAAAELGVAMQLTNILRDLGSDLRHGRSYLPADELARFGYSPARLQFLARSSAPLDDSFRALMRFQIQRAQMYYTSGLAGVWLLPPEVRLAVLIAGRVYRAILKAIEAQNYNVLRQRATVSHVVKLREVLTAVALVHLWGRDSTRAFGTISSQLETEAQSWHAFS